MLHKTLTRDQMQNSDVLKIYMFQNDSKPYVNVTCLVLIKLSHEKC